MVHYGRWSSDIDLCCGVVINSQNIQWINSQLAIIIIAAPFVNSWPIRFSICNKSVKVAVIRFYRFTLFVYLKRLIYSPVSAFNLNILDIIFPNSRHFIAAWVSLFYRMPVAFLPKISCLCIIDGFWMLWFQKIDRFWQLILLRFVNWCNSIDRCNRQSWHKSSK